MAGVPVGRQGQLHAACRADRASVARAAAGGHSRLQSRPGAAGLSGHRPARVPDEDGRAAPDRIRRHLFHRPSTRSRRGAPTARSARGSGAGTSTESRGRKGVPPWVLGHHRDDILETFFLNLFHGGKLATMPPKLLNDEGDLFVLRPLAHVAEADCERFLPRDGTIPSFPATSAAVRTGCNGRSSNACSTSGRTRPPAGGRSCFRR